MFHRRANAEDRSEEFAAPAVLTTLANGVRVVALGDDALHTAAVSVFVRCGSVHERRADSGIGHVVEHMVFKGAAGRDAHRINLDAESLGADVNAHTDKDHTAFHMRGRPADAPAFVRMLADLVRAPDFPADEVERERGVLLHEMTEVEDDPMATAYQLFDRGCYGAHPAAQPVIGLRRNVERFTRADLVAWVERHYTGTNIIVAAIGPIDADAVVRSAEAALGTAPAGHVNAIEPPAWVGGVHSRRLAGGNQSHVVLGFPVEPMNVPGGASELAAVLFGEGMSSPLMAQLRERRALAYYAACAVDRYAYAGQFAVEVSTDPDSLDEALRELIHLLAAQADRIDAVDLARARHQMEVRQLRARESATRRLESAALDLFVLGRMRSPAERRAEFESLSGADVRDALQRMLQAPASLALAGRIGRGAGERARAALAGLGG